MPAPRRYLIAILGVSILLRAAAAFYLGNEVTFLPGVADQVSYHTLALRVLGGHGFSFGEPWWPATPPDSPTAHWSYLYTLFLAGLYAVLGPAPLVARLIQAGLVGLLQPYLAYRIGSRVFGQRVGLVAAGLTAGYAYFIYYAAALMTEAFYICAVLAVLYLALPGEQEAGAEAMRPAPGGWAWALALGLAAGIAVLFRQVFLLFLPVLFAWIWWQGFRQGRGRRTAAQLTLAGGVVLSLILPFTVYNYARFQQFVLLNSNAGFAFYWANHPVYGTQFEPIISNEAVNYLTLLPSELRGLNEVELDRALLQRGLGFVVADPLRYLRLSASRIPIFLMFWPSPDSSLVSNLSRVASFGLLWPFMLYGVLLAMVGVGRREAPAGGSVAVLLLFALVYTGIHVFSWTLVRYRLPVDAVLLVFAALGLRDLASRLRLRLPAGRVSRSLPL